MLIQRVGNHLMLAVFGEQSPPDDEWQEYLRVMTKIEPDDLLFILSAGGGPALMQRRDLEQVTGHHRGRVAVVTTSRMARGIVTALSWMEKNIKAFDPGRRNDAFEYLEISEGLRPILMRRLKAMADHLGVAEQLDL